MSQVQFMPCLAFCSPTGISCLPRFYLALISHFVPVPYSFSRHFHVSSKVKKWTSPVLWLGLLVNSIPDRLVERRRQLRESDILGQEMPFMEYLTRSDPLWSTTLDNWPHPTIETPCPELQREIDRLNPEIRSTLHSHGPPSPWRRPLSSSPRGSTPETLLQAPTPLKIFSELPGVPRQPYLRTLCS